MTYTNAHHRQLMAVLTIIAGGVYANWATGWLDLYFIVATLLLSLAMLKHNSIRQKLGVSNV